MKILKSKKALSPVVASIILIAVTVAVSIAVAAWMGALTFTFTATEQVSITNMEFLGTTSKVIRLTVNNTGTSPVTINEVWVNNVKYTATNPTLPKTISANTGLLLDVTYTWTTGYNYQVKLVSARGNTFLYSAVAPQT